MSQKSIHALNTNITQKKLKQGSNTWQLCAVLNHNGKWALKLVCIYPHYNYHLGNIYGFSNDAGQLKTWFRNRNREEIWNPNNTANKYNLLHTAVKTKKVIKYHSLAMSLCCSLNIWQYTGNLVTKILPNRQRIKGIRKRRPQKIWNDDVEENLKII
jgi:hypothetical protein